MSNFVAGYHLAPIPKGVLGRVSKVREELEEALDAQAQCAEVMVLVELSDLVGAWHAWHANHAAALPLSLDPSGPLLGSLAAWLPRLRSLEPLEESPGRDALLQTHLVLLDLRQEIEAWLEHHHPTIGWTDLEIMARITARAFASGRRTAEGGP